MEPLNTKIGMVKMLKNINHRNNCYILGSTYIRYESHGHYHERYKRHDQSGKHEVLYFVIKGHARANKALKLDLLRLGKVYHNWTLLQILKHVDYSN